MPKKQAIALLAPILAHYRRDVYRYLSGATDFDFVFLGGKKYENIQRIKELKSFTFNFLSFRLAKHKFYYLRGTILKIFKLKPKVIISSGVDFHLIHTLILFFIYRILLRGNFYWWSQGTRGNQGKLGWWLRKWVYKKSSGVMLYSKSGYDNLIKMGITPSRLSVLNNCLNEEDYGFLNYNLQQRKIESTNVKLLFTGRISEKVDLKVLIESIACLNEISNNKVSCYIIGGGDVEYYSGLVKKRGLEDQISFLGPVYGKAAHPYFLESDIFVYPGGIGLSIVHALSFGLPVITTDNLKLHNPEVELLNSEYNGDFYEEGNPEDLANVIFKWINIMKSHNKDIAARCINTVRDFEYLPKQVGEKVLRHLKMDLNLNAEKYE